MATNMSGAQFFVQTMKTFDDMEYRREQSLRDESFRRDQLAERTRQFDASADYNRDQLAERKRQFDLSHKMNGRRVSVAEKNLKLAETSAANLKEKEQKVKEAQLAYMEEEQAREDYSREQQETFERGFNRLRSGNMVDISHFAYGPNVDSTMLNGARGNSGRGAGIFTKYDPETGRHYAFTKDQETGEYLPFSRDPEDNESPQLFFEDNNIMESLFTINGTRNDIEQMDEDGSVMSAFYNNNMNLVTDENGRVVTRRRADIEAQARNEVDARNAQIEKENAAKQPAPEPESELKAWETEGRTGGLKAILGESASITLDLTAETFGSVGDALETLWNGSETPEGAQQKAAALADKVKGKDPERQKKIIYSEYLKEKYGETFKASERNYIAKYREGSIGAVEASKSQRKKVAEMMIDAGIADVSKLNNYIETGSMKSPAELAAAGLQRRKDQIEVLKGEAELAKLYQDLDGGAIDPQDQLKFMSPMVDRAVGATTSVQGFQKGAGFDFSREKDKLTTAWSTWMVSSGYKFDGSFEDQEVITAGTKVYYALNDVMRESGMTLDSMDAAVAIAAKFPEDVGNPEALRARASTMVREAEERGASVDVIGREWLRGD